MFVFQRKVGDTGEIHAIVTEQDRAQLFCEGTKWIDLNDTLNDFNKDPDITDCKLTVCYAGDLKDEHIRRYMDNLKIIPTNTNTNNNQETKDNSSSKKDKVDTNGRIIKTNEDGEEWESDETISEYLQNEELKCPKCGDIGKALVNKDGDILPCESCMKIDAFLEGKKKGFEEGFDKGYESCMKFVEKILSKSGDGEELTEETIETLLKNSIKKESKDGKQDK